ncbi:FAD-binding oxidoreductase [Arachidicoccus sp.]|uniref:FAD-binding oxidoreductase n=1 Tax=Arachidicoccus sp. TaxID=1872624 RepID=UPI003D1F9C87
MKQAVKIISKKYLTHDVLRIMTEKPVGLAFEAGQAVDISINKKGLEEELRSFTFTSLPEDDYLEFTIKTYPSHGGITQQLLSLAEGDELFVHDVYGDIIYKGEGIFIAGGAGVTPFIAILKQLEKQNEVGANKLIFANKTKADIILEEHFHKLLGKNFINILSSQQYDGYLQGYISAELIKKHINGDGQYYYLCGPEPMMQAVEGHLTSLGIADQFIVKEAF